MVKIGIIGRLACGFWFIVANRYFKSIMAKRLKFSVLSCKVKKQKQKLYFVRASEPPAVPRLPGPRGGKRVSLLLRALHTPHQRQRNGCGRDQGHQLGLRSLRHHKARRLAHLGQH